MNVKTIGCLLFVSAFIAGCSTSPTALPHPTATSTPAVVVTSTPLPTRPHAVEPSLTPSVPPAASATQSQPTAAPQPTSTPQAVPPEQQACADAALFVDDVTIPDFSTLAPAQDFVKTWRLRNAGSCAWGSGYFLSFLSGEPMTGKKGFPLPPANPGDTIDVSVDMVAPDNPGGYTGNWQIINPRGQAIPMVSSEDNYFWIKLNVSGPAAANPSAPVTPVGAGPTPASQAVPVTAPVVTPATGCAFVQDSAFENAVLALINQERSSRGVPALTRNTQLDAAALSHSLDMSCNNFVEHYGSNGSTWFTRINQAGYSYRYASENIAAGNPAFGGSADWVVEIRWMNSQVHRENILNPQVTEIGLAYVFNSVAQWGGYTTVDFAQP